MSAHWRLALQYGAWVSVGAVLVGAVIWFLFGEAYAGSFLYGVGVGIVSFVSTALTVSMLTGCSRAVGVLIGAGSFWARYGFAAGRIGGPADLGALAGGGLLVGLFGGFFGGD